MNYKEIKAVAQAWNTVQEAKFAFDIPEDIGTMERTAFHGAAAGAHKAGKSHFNFNGKKYPVTMKKDTAKAIADDVDEGVMDKVKSVFSKKPKKPKPAAFGIPGGPNMLDRKPAAAGKKTTRQNNNDRMKKMMSPGSGFFEAATHKPNNGQEMGDGLSPSAKAQLANKTPMPDDVDGPAINKKSFDAMRKSLKTAPKRSGDNDAGDKNIMPSATQVKEDMDKVHTVDIDHHGGYDANAKKHNITIKHDGNDAADASGKKKDLQKYLAKHYDSKADAKGNHPAVYETVMSADKKPEKYMKPDGKVGIRMVRVNKKVIDKDK